MRSIPNQLKSPTSSETREIYFPQLLITLASHPPHLSYPALLFFLISDHLCIIFSLTKILLREIAKRIKERGKNYRIDGDSVRMVDTYEKNVSMHAQVVGV
jgi:hypothetical protein